MASKQTVVGRIRRIKPDGSVGKPELRYTGWGLAPYDEVVNFYDLVVPEGARIAYVPVSVGSHCIVIEHQGKYYYFKIIDDGSVYSMNFIVKVAEAIECRPLA
jgi:hemin uptake protein HemP